MCFIYFIFNMPILYICLTIYAISVFVKIISFSEPTVPNISFHKS